MKPLLLTLLAFTFANTYGQLSIVHASFSEFNVTPSILSQITVNNISSSGSGSFQIKLTNTSNQPIFTATSNQVQINKGVTVFNSANLKFSTLNFTSTPQGKYVSNTHRLSSGGYNYCVSFIPSSGIEQGDDYCQSISAENNEALYLVYPADKEEIETTTPVLTWMHTEAFNLLNEGEFFKITVVEMNTDQSKEEAILTNSPTFLKNRIFTHNVPYSLDAESLEYGKKYAWQVQKVSNGNIIASTEVWEFSLASSTNDDRKVFVKLKEKSDGSIYYVYNEMIYFRFDERYSSSNKLTCSISNVSNISIKAEVVKVDDSEESKSTGYNSYEIDLSTLNLNNGYYTLTVSDEKGKNFFLKFLIEK